MYNDEHIHNGFDFSNREGVRLWIISIIDEIQQDENVEEAKRIINQENK